MDFSTSWQHHRGELPWGPYKFVSVKQLSSILMSDLCIRMTLGGRRACMWVFNTASIHCPVNQARPHHPWHMSLIPELFTLPHLFLSDSDWSLSFPIGLLGIWPYSNCNILPAKFTWNGRFQASFVWVQSDLGQSHFRRIVRHVWCNITTTSANLITRGFECGGSDHHHPHVPSHLWYFPC